ncbi:hypothetical protein A0256_09090 [Mucilaginibacter sp. PAMC 26640]|nr:hypothetical protein A0256_09090 [Mucilaginibacter sp. PAMC 26640]
MSVSEKRRAMEEALKSIVIPFLRSQGFKGTFPHFRRVADDRINLLTFQFSSSSSKFTVEIANCSIKGIHLGWGEDIKPTNCTAHHINRRHRLGSLKGDHWFDFSKVYILLNIYKQRAHEIISLWGDAESWWETDPFDQRSAMVPFES